MKVFPFFWSRGARFPRGLGGALTAALLVLGAGTAFPAPPVSPDAPLPLYRIDLTPDGAWAALLDADLDVMSVRPEYRATVLGWPGTRAAMDAAGLCYTEVRPDFGVETAIRTGRVPFAYAPPPVPADTGGVPPFGEGSLAGFWTLDEVYALLDSLAATDSLVAGLDTLGMSLQGRPIVGLAVASPDRPLGSRPEVLYTALTHAREPEGMQVVLYFLLRLLGDYGSDPELTYLVNEREMWFVPVVNPDGYVRNENTWRSGGVFGFWRKNLRDNNGDSLITNQDGVDLNRNFGFEWGYDNVGSSGNPTSPTYRGTAPFSEPETQVVRDFCEQHAFVTAENYHTYAEDCLYPWGYIAADTPDSAAFVRLGDELAEVGHYAYGRSGQLLYPVNGEVNDWMYGDVSGKPKVFGFTTEVGDQNDGFWPPQSRILPLAELNFRANVALAYAAGAYLVADSVRVENETGRLAPGETAGIGIQLRNLGVEAATSGGVSVTVASGDPAVSVGVALAAYPDLSPGSTAWPSPGPSVTVTAGVAAEPGTRAPLYLELADGAGYTGRDTVWIRLGDPVVVFADSGNAGLSNWSVAGSWGLEAVDGDTAFSDSPGGNYPSYDNARLTLNQPLDLRGAARAVLAFRTKWDIEGGYDFGRVEVSADSGATWTAVAGLLTRSGHGTTLGYEGGTQPPGVPGYDGNQRFWAAEEIDLSAYAGVSDLRLRFRLTSDVAVQMDGWYLDDITLLLYPPSAALAVHEPPSRPERGLRVLPGSPNPLRDRTEIRFVLPAASPVVVSVFDVSGRRVRVLSEGYAEAGVRTVVWDGRRDDGRRAASGAYFVRIRAASGNATTKVLLVR
jgi:carboxypeptidase T